MTSFLLRRHFSAMLSADKRKALLLLYEREVEKVKMMTSLETF